jgi:hypothetical protein
MKKVILSCVVIIFLSSLACNSTQTKQQFSSLNLENQLVIEGDLPPGFSSSQIKTTPLAKAPDKAPAADFAIDQLLSRDGMNGGAVTVLLYEDINKAKAAYQPVVDNWMRSTTDGGVGEKSLVSIVKLPLPPPAQGVILDLANLVFVRCHAVVHIQLMDYRVNKDDIIAYGLRLDKRLQKLICRP